MKRVMRFLCLLTALCMASAGAAWAEPTPADPVTIVSYDPAALPDWAPGYGLSMPGLLLELTHPEAMFSVTAIEMDSVPSSTYQSTVDYLSGLLDRAGEMLVVSDAQMTIVPYYMNGTISLSYSYTYPESDEVHLIRTWAVFYNDMLIDMTVDAWGEEAVKLIEAIQSAFIDCLFPLTVYEEALELTATLSDVVEDETGLVSIQLTAPGAPFSPDAPFYQLAENAVILFPRPDDPMLLCPVLPDYASLADAILLYEESSDSPAVFYTLIENNQIIYMEYGLMQ